MDDFCEKQVTDQYDEKIEIYSFTEALDKFIVFAEKVLQYDVSGELKLTSA